MFELSYYVRMDDRSKIMSENPKVSNVYLKEA
jgi:hypothetical protein